MKLGKKKLQELKNKKILIEKLSDRYFINSQYRIEIENILKLLNGNSCSLKEIVDKFKSIKNDDNDPCLKYLLYNEEFFEELIQNTRLNKEDLKYLLNTIDKWYELECLCTNTSLIKYILNEFVLDKELVDRLNRVVENHNWYKDSIHTIFDLIEYFNKNNEEILELNELNKYVYSFDEDQRLELIDVLKNNEIAQNRLIQLIDNHLESNYDSESLIAYLKKKEKKSILNI